MKICLKPWSNPSKLSSASSSPASSQSSSGHITMLLLVAICIFCSSKAWAASGLTAVTDDDATAASTSKADTRAIRLSSAEGQVQVVQDGQVIADPAYSNLPLFEGSQILTGNDGRAEIQLEDGSVARLSPNTTLTISVLQQQGTDTRTTGTGTTGTRTEMVLNGGLAYFELQPSTAEHSLRVYYGQTGFTATAFSVVRISEDTPPGDLAVLSGNVHLERGDNLQLDIHGGESLSLDASDLNQYNLAESIQPDSWDSWNSDRDQVLNSQVADKTAASNSLGNYQDVGLSDLDANGNWYNVPGQGYIWSPYEAQSGGGAWDPYGYGHWVYYPRFGYVWVSGYGWGYAPFQCGLWNFYDNFGWGWAPGNGCNPWWGGEGFFGGGGGGWFNIGIPPRGYRPPRRPFPGPIRPRPIPRTGPRQGGVSTRPLVASVAPVAVDRRVAGTTELSTTARTGEPVTIAGYTVEPLRPLAPRQAYTHSGSAFVNRAAPVHYGSVAGAHGVYNGSTYNSAGHPAPGQAGARPAAPVSRPAAPHAAPSGGGGGHPSGGGAAPHSSGGSGGTHK
jgi:ferric-dicitrate binding protein FerR (iron transport regulator)